MKEYSNNNLNTSHVKVKLKNYSFPFLDYKYLNTSHVKVKPERLQNIYTYLLNLNTSHVKVKQNFIRLQ